MYGIPIHPDSDWSPIQTPAEIGNYTLLVVEYKLQAHLFTYFTYKLQC